ncbi:Gfo/Idh/MocA family oxidoreductase [bacterium]|nr:Gfo/Idh/MocA family oxidoreductase [bacterium]
MSLNRRDFVKASTAVTVSMALPAGRANALSETGDVRVAAIGVNGRGVEHLQSMKNNIVAICDCDEKVLRLRADLFERMSKRKVDREVDYRKLVERKDIDAVSIATPNHTHSLIAIAAIQAGKDVYVEKPVSHNVWEGRQLVHAARKYDRIVQCGTQSRSSPSLKQAAAWLHEGNIGPIQYAIATCYKPRKAIGKLNEPLKIDKDVHYDLWCGPAEMVDLYRPRLHYDWHWDFNTGNGDLGNQGIHQMDIARWFLGENALSPRVMSVGGRLGYEDGGNTPNTQIVFHDYAKAPLIFEVRGLPKSKADQKNWSGDTMDNYRGSRVGVIVQCEGGSIVIPSYSSATAFDKDGKEIKSWNGGGNHFGNFLDAVKEHKREMLHAEVLEGHLSSALCHTGNVSYQLGKTMPAGQIREEIKGNARALDSFERMVAHLRANEVDVESSSITIGPWLEMDPAKETFLENEKASSMLTRKYRAPFTVPTIA